MDELVPAWHEIPRATIVIEALGVVLDRKVLRVKHKPRRAWRLYLGIGEQLRQGTAAG